MGSAQSEPDADPLSQQVRAASRWPQAAQEARGAGVPNEDIQALFEFVRENDYSSRDVRRLVVSVAGQANAWGPEEIVELVITRLRDGETPLDVRERIMGGPAVRHVDPNGGPVPGSGGGGNGEGWNHGEERDWAPGSGRGPGNGAGQAAPPPERDWPARSGGGPGDRSGVGNAAEDGTETEEGANE